MLGGTKAFFGLVAREFSIVASISILSPTKVRPRLGLKSLGLKLGMLQKTSKARLS